MERYENFDIIRTGDNRAQFIRGEVTITIGQFACDNDKHYIADPLTARANFECSGEYYTVNNANGFSTVEDWYLEELLPKVQMMALLLSTDPLW
jgi:hypothetical protein